ncbi:MAG TPA: bacteriohemerythrin [Bacteroidota bacterium]|jgi:hemerythrin|nr:bacteriohemerythrin [Bacteroidota bacterium]
MVNIISWDEKYAINVPRIDEQHQILFNYLNEYYDSLANGKSLSIIDSTLKKLIDYANYHFKDEEDFMTLLPDYDFHSHKNQHNYFIVKVQEMSNMEREEINFELFNFMKEWILNHVLITDKKMGQYK